MSNTVVLPGFLHLNAEVLQTHTLLYSILVYTLQSFKTSYIPKVSIRNIINPQSSIPTLQIPAGQQPSLRLNSDPQPLPDLEAALYFASLPRLFCDAGILTVT